MVLKGIGSRASENHQEAIREDRITLALLFHCQKRQYLASIGKIPKQKKLVKGNSPSIASEWQTKHKKRY
jgi:hypothetical protein